MTPDISELPEVWAAGIDLSLVYTRPRHLSSPLLKPDHSDKCIHGAVKFIRMC